MPGGFPLGLDVSNGQAIGTNPTSSPSGTAVTASASTNTKGSWAQLIASTAADCVWLIVSIAVAGSATINTIVDIGVGAAASEVVLIPNLPAPYTGGSYGVSSIALPLHIPAGTRISARAASSTGSSPVRVSILTFDGAFTQQEGFAGVDAYGVNTSASRGTSVTAGSGAYGSYVQFSASTTRDYAGFFMAFTNLAAPTNTRTRNVELSIGGSGSEQVIIPDYQIATNNTNGAHYSPSISHFIPIAVPAGTRLAVRVEEAGGAEAVSIIVYGVYL